MLMCRAFVALVAVLLAILAWPATGSAALSCGLPETQPVWLDFADSSVSFWRERFARPGVVVATGGPALAAEARAAGAATVHWDMYLRKRVGTPSDPADPALMDERADKLFDYAVAVSGCQQPLIALNELWGASLPTPLTPTAERYRVNVLRFVSRLAARGGRPALLVSSEPYTGGDAAAWWKSVAAPSPCAPSTVRSEAPRTRDPILANRDHDRLPDGTGYRRTRRAGAAVPLVQRREVARARRATGCARATARSSLVVGLGAAERALQRSGQDLCRMRLAVGA